MSKNILWGLIIFSFARLSHAQDICIGSKHSIYSKSLNENREIWIHLPEHYSNKKYLTNKYPVLYLLDGEKHFAQVAAIADALSGSMYTNMPETIIVGIINTDRSRDLTPTKDTIMHSGVPIHTTSGGAGNFLSFITSELSAYIDSTYRTNGYNFLSGHSFGGLFTLYALLNDPAFFNAFLAHDPSLWWDNQYMFEELKTKLPGLDLSKKALYLSVANFDTTEKDRFNHSETIMAFHEYVTGNNASGLKFYQEFFEKEDHGTIPMPGNYQGLKTLFKGITLPVKKVPFHPELIESTYSLLSQKIGFPVIPEEYLLNNLAGYSSRLLQTEAELYIRKLQIKLYPNSPYAQLELAKFYFRDKNNDLGNKHFKLAVGLSPELEAVFHNEIKSKSNKP